MSWAGVGLSWLLGLVGALYSVREGFVQAWSMKE